jgi:general stress protein YciG
VSIKLRGFASMDPEKQREICRKGGLRAHAKGMAHEWTSDEARVAGRAGGKASRGGGRPKKQEVEDGKQVS